MQTRVRVAMVGAGAMANMVHYPSLASFEDVEIAAICDLDPDRLARTADAYGVERRYADYRVMIEQVAPDAVYAIGPPHVMVDVWIWCLSRGLNLYVEKPLGLTVHQAQMLAYLAQRNGCITQVSFQRRSCPMVVLLREKCLERGPITHAVCEFLKCAPDPFCAAIDRLHDDGVHAIDTLRWMCGGEAEAVHAVARRVGTPDINFVSALVEFSTGATGVLTTSWTSGRRTFRVQMHAPGICAEAEHETRGMLYADGDTGGAAYEPAGVAGSEQAHVAGGFAAKNREFIDAVRTRTLPGSHFGDAVKTMELAARILAVAGGDRER